MTVCPYDQDGNPEQGMRAAAWIRGYARQRRQARRAHLRLVK